MLRSPLNRYVIAIRLKVTGIYDTSRRYHASRSLLFDARVSITYYERLNLIGKLKPELEFDLFSS